MARRILVIQGHPDSNDPHFCHAIGRAYEEGATKAGHEVRVLDVGKLDFPLLRRPHDFEKGEPPPAIGAAQDDIRWAQHLVIIYPLWLGTLPALLKAFFEQTFRYGFAMGLGGTGLPRKLLKGRSARIIVTMGMPAMVYRALFRAHGLKSLESGVLSLSGIGPIRSTLFGRVAQVSAGYRRRFLDDMRELGRRAD